MRISKNFTLAEFTHSATAERRGINNTPSPEAVAHISELVNEILQPIRDAWGKPITVTSGYRCPELNKAVGGVKNSSHLTGWAADIQCADMSEFQDFVDFIEGFAVGRNLLFDQILFERSASAKWVHIGLRRNDGAQRRQLFGVRV